MYKSDSSFNVLYTADVEKTHHFFREIGATIEQFESDKVVVRFGSFDLHFILDSTEPCKAYKYISVPQGYGQGIIFYIETKDIAQAKIIIEKAGGITKTNIFENHWGYLELLFEDPNGYKFALYQEK